MMLLASGDVEAEEALLSEGYELVGERSFPVQTERGRAWPSYVRFTVRQITEPPAWQEELDALRTEAERLRTEVESLTVQLTERTAALDEREAEAERLRAEADQLRAENKGLQNELETMRAAVEAEKKEKEEAAARKAREEKLSLFRQPGNIVTFGQYEQDADETNGSEAIEWIVLDYDEANHKSLLLSRYGLDAQPYNTELVDITWEQCTLRTWLNGTFLNKAFTAGEQKEILLTNVDNGSSQGYSEYGASGGNNTQDKIFLLSCAEANKYFSVTSDDRNNMKSRVAPTAYASEQGAWTSDEYKTADGSAAGWWWLRSPGYSQRIAATVHHDGSLVFSNVDDDSGCVRPAMWINLESEIF